MEPRVKNIAILAHIDAGKTTLSERILFLGKTIHNLGEVDEGLATMDYLQEEKKRGITIEAGWSHFLWKNWRINLIDTPGHIDFGAEVDCVLEAIDGGVIVLSAVRGVQTQTVESWNKLQKHDKKTLFFINKTEMQGLGIDDLLFEIEDAFSVPPYLMTYPVETPHGYGVVDVIAQKLLIIKHKESRDVLLVDLEEDLLVDCLDYRKELCNLASEYNEEVLEALVNEQEPKLPHLYEGLARALQKGAFLPVYCGSAKMNVGVRSLMNGVRFMLPSAEQSSLDSSILGKVINVRFQAGYGKIYLFKVHAMMSHPPEDIRFYSVNADSLVETGLPSPGDLCAVLTDKVWKIGDSIDFEGSVCKSEGRPNYDSLMHFRMEPESAEDAENLQKGLRFFEETEPGMSLRYDSNSGSWDVGVVGEVFFEVLAERLKYDFKVNATASEPRVEIREWLLEKTWEGSHDLHADGCHLEAKVRIARNDSPASKVKLRLPQMEENRYWMIRNVSESALMDFVKEGVTGKGHLLGVRFEILELNVEGTLLPGLLKKLLSYLLKNLIKPVDVLVEEPFVRLEAFYPEEFSSVVMGDISQRGGVIKNVFSDGKWDKVVLELPLKETFGYTTDLRSITKGRGSFDMTYLEHRSLG